MGIAKKIGGGDLITKINQLIPSAEGFLPMRYLGKAVSVWTHTATANDFYFECDPRDEDVIITLPTAASSTGAVYVVKTILIDSQVKIVPASGDYIDDAQDTALTLASNGECVILISGFGRWRSIAHITGNP